MEIKQLRTEETSILITLKIKLKTKKETRNKRFKTKYIDLFKEQERTCRAQA